MITRTTMAGIMMLMTMMLAGMIVIPLKMRMMMKLMVMSVMRVADEGCV
jgi:hypothetical protein